VPLGVDGSDGSSGAVHSGEADLRPVRDSTADTLGKTSQVKEWESAVRTATAQQALLRVPVLLVNRARQGGDAATRRHVAHHGAADPVQGRERGLVVADGLEHHPFLGEGDRHSNSSHFGSNTHSDSMGIG
jgi:hypothetical protein